MRVNRWLTRIDDTAAGSTTSHRLFAYMGGLLVLVTVMFSNVIGPGGASAASARLKIVALGDSLTAGYRLRPDEAFPVQLLAALKLKGIDADIINAGVSGDTATGGLERLDWSVPPGTQAVILELGANDALRGIDPAQTYKALDTIITRLKQRGIEVLLAGIEAPRNLGDEYARKFNAIYADLAKRHDLILHPFFLQGVVLDAGLTLDDRMHPNAKGVAVIVQNIVPRVLAMLDRIKKPA